MFCILSFISIGRTSSGFDEDAADRETKTAPLRRRNAAKTAFPRTQSCALLYLLKNGTSTLGVQAAFNKQRRRAQAFLLSDPPHPWVYFDYDPGPLSCVHLQNFTFSGHEAPLQGVLLHLLFYYSAAKKHGQP
ncbi:hypothetical protein [Faecalibacterium langellae]|jgi:hypothetical protein|uniref:hypothetical protein n=1 Tax=Faecalibacterium langellae TaxID=3435293 RepID=UPI0015CF6E41|nr:hypothetical protein [Faecalibacterium prausnitzii]